MAQTSISANPSVGIVGDLASSLAGTTIISRVAAEAIPFGTFVVLTADDEDTCELPDATGEAAGPRGLGVALRKPEDTSGAYAAGEVVEIVTVGEVFVATEDAATAGDTAFVRFADAATTLGTFRSDADTADADDVKGAVFMTTTATAGATVRVRLNGTFFS